ncbi:MFS domain-containing protein [Mycena chlorophos]|uniref:MFS domain-containing protein n=1 Tax=Mycena chlorophos TaxID=658473 RepID=A0A8H6WKK3_MYCCL|nr:MFS domain-containing protein [Mycena chlorophos]
MSADAPVDKPSSPTTSTDEKLAVQSSNFGGDDHSESDVAENSALEGVWTKMDFYVLPLVTLFWLLSFLDRTNIGNAKVAGLLTSLKMDAKQYSIALTVTYVPYIVAELPSNLLLKKVGPHRLLPTLLTLWGIVATAQGAVTSYHGLLAARFFLGLCEGGVFPGLVLYLSYFYPRQKLQLRVAMFFSAAAFSGAFSGIMAYGIQKHLTGSHGRLGWQWIFIIEGVITIFIGVVSFFLWPASVASAYFLTEEEKQYVTGRLKVDGAIQRREEADGFRAGEILKAFTSLHVLLIGAVLFFSGTTLFALAYFTPSILASLGYVGSKAQLMSVPPYSVAFVVSVITAIVSDRFRARGYITFIGSLLCIAGFAMFLKSTNHHVQYGSLFLSIPGTYIIAPTLSTWAANNSAPYTRRATTIAIVFSCTNSGGILSTWLLSTISPPPRYTEGTRILLAFNVSIGVGALLLLAYLKRENKKKAEVRKSVSREEEEEGLGDKSAWFEYSL